MSRKEEKNFLKEKFETYQKRNNLLWESIDISKYELDIEYLNNKYKEINKQ